MKLHRPSLPLSTTSRFRPFRYDSEQSRAYGCTDVHCHFPLKLLLPSSFLSVSPNSSVPSVSIPQPPRNFIGSSSMAFRLPIPSSASFGKRHETMNASG